MSRAQFPSRVRDALVALVTATLIAAVPAAAPAATLVPECGQRITRSVVLHENLSNCPGVGLIVSGESAITLDLNGFAITGAAGSSTGILVEHSSKVRLLGSGDVSGFETGVWLRDSVKLHVEKIRLRGNRQRNIALERVSRSLLTDVDAVSAPIGVHFVGPETAGNQLQLSYVFDNQQGVVFEGASGNRVYDSSIMRNRFGVKIVNGSRNVLKANYISHSRVGVTIENASTGFGPLSKVPSLLPAYADENLLDHNTVVYHKVGVRLAASSAGYLQRNRIENGSVLASRTGIELVGINTFETQIEQMELIVAVGDAIVDGGTATTITDITCRPVSC